MADDVALGERIEHQRNTVHMSGCAFDRVEPPVDLSDIRDCCGKLTLAGFAVFGGCGFPYLDHGCGRGIQRPIGPLAPLVPEIEYFVEYRRDAHGLIHSPKPAAKLARWIVGAED